MPQQNNQSARVRVQANERYVSEQVVPVGQDGRWPSSTEPTVAIEYARTGAADVRVLAAFDHLVIESQLRPPADSGVALGPLVIQRRDGKPITRTEFAALGLGALYRLLERVMEQENVVEQLGPEWGAVRLPRPGRRGRDDLYFARIAQRYVTAMRTHPRSPVKALIEQEEGHVSEDEMRGRLRRARDRDLLTRPDQGKAGGALTRKAVDLLRASGLFYEEGEA